jgi:hypothetical protein
MTTVSLNEALNTLAQLISGLLPGDVGHHHEKTNGRWPKSSLYRAPVAGRRARARP